MLLLPFKVAKKHWIIHLLWFLFVPIVSSISLLFNLLNFETNQIASDITMGYFYIVSISLICSCIYDIVVCFYEYVIESHKDSFMSFKLKCLFVLLSLIIPTILLHITKVGKYWWIQVPLFLIVCFFSFYVRLVFKMEVYLDEQGEYLSKEKNEMQKIDESSQKTNNPKTPDGGELKL